jgi:hypothetical protein
MSRQKILAVIILLLLPVAAWCLWDMWRDHRREAYLRNLDLVAFSTSMIGSPNRGQVEAELQLADKAGIDLMDMYRECRKRGERFSLAWMLISRESPEYFQDAKTHIADVPWPEARIWCVRLNDKDLSTTTREQLLDLLAASPTSEAQLHVGRIFRSHGKATAAEESFYAAMTGKDSQFWDALDAADELKDSQRYHDEAMQYLLKIACESEYAVFRSSASIARECGQWDELEGFIRECEREPKNAAQRAKLKAILTELVERDRTERRYDPALN